MQSGLRDTEEPMEACIFFSAYLICLYISLPMYLFYGFKLGMVLGPIQAHCGYDLGKIVKGPAHHYLHHSLQRGNFGGFPTGIWDKLFGTEIVNPSSTAPLSAPVRKLAL